MVSLCSPDSDLSFHNGCLRYPEVSSNLLCKAWKDFGCMQDVFISIWSQENGLFECQKLRKKALYIIVKTFEKHVVTLCFPDSDLSIPNRCWRYLGVSAHFLCKAWNENTSRYLQSPFLTLRSLSGGKAHHVFFEDFDCISENSKKHWVFSQLLSLEKSNFLAPNRSENVPCASKTFSGFTRKMRRYFWVPSTSILNA